MMISTNEQFRPETQPDSNFVDLTEDSLRGAREVEYLELIRKLKSDLIDKTSECEMLKIKLDESSRNNEKISQELNECRLNIFERNEDSNKTHEEITRSKKLEEDYVKLMNDFLNLGEQTELYRLALHDRYHIKTNIINNIECLKSSGVIENELEVCKADLRVQSANTNLATAKIRSLEEDNNIKEKCITELRKSLDDAKVTHKHEITVLEEYISSLKNTIKSYETTLSGYARPRDDET